MNRLHASRYSLRRWRKEDAAWYAAVRDEEIFRFTTETECIDADSFVDALSGLDDSNRTGFALLSDEALAGNVAAVRNGRIAELSYWVAADARGRGAASAGLAMLARWVTDHWDVGRLELLIHPENAGSIRVAEKAGFTAAGMRETTMSCAGPDGKVLVFCRDVVGAGR
jgi:ribosomal-protein-alanine N-acetyltransferase